MNHILFTLFIVCIFCISTSIQYVPNPTCFGQICPINTSNCKQQRQSNADKSKIETRISCLDDYDETVKDYYFEEISYIDRYTNYQSTKYESINQKSNRNNFKPYEQAKYRGLEQF